MSFSGTVASPQQIHNANLTNFLYQAWARLVKLSEEHTPSVFSVLQPSTQVGISYIMIFLCIGFTYELLEHVQNF